MPKLPINIAGSLLTSDPIMRKNMVNIKEMLYNLDADNLNGRILSGTTNSTANTQTLFNHNLQTTPMIVIPIRGNVYIYDFNETTIDIRSTQTSVNFDVFVVEGKFSG